MEKVYRLRFIQNGKLKGKYKNGKKSQEWWK